MRKQIFLSVLFAISLVFISCNGYAYSSDPNEAPDLVVAQIVNLDRNLEIDETRRIEILIGNLNSASAENVKVKYQIWNLDLNDESANHGFVEAEEVVPLIAGQQRAAVIFDYKAVYPANYRLRVWVDQTNRIQETNEANNMMEKAFSVEGGLTPAMVFTDKDVDLSIDKNIQVSAQEPPVGSSVSFIVNVHNNSDVEVWGANAAIFVNDDKIEAKDLETIPPQSSKQLTFYHAFWTTGDYPVKIMVDAQDAVPENNEVNNTATTTIKVKAGLLGSGHKDVAVTNFTLSTASCIRGESVTAEATVKNLGEDMLKGVLVTIGVVDATPAYIKMIPELKPGEEIKLSTTFPALTVGDYELKAVVDGTDIIKEEDEDNNVKIVALHVEPLSGEQAKAKALTIIAEKIGRMQEAIGRWIKELGKSKPQPTQ